MEEEHNSETFDHQRMNEFAICWRILQVEKYWCNGVRFEAFVRLCSPQLHRIQKNMYPAQAYSHKQHKYGSPSVSSNETRPTSWYPRPRLPDGSDLDKKWDGQIWCGFHKYGSPKIDGLFQGKSHLEMDDLGVPLFQETSISWFRTNCL